MNFVATKDCVNTDHHHETLLARKNKVKFFGHDDQERKAAILECVDPDQLPVAYGGTLTDPDGNPNCITMASPLYSLIDHRSPVISLKSFENAGEYGRKSSEILLFALQA